ncbi:MAG: GntR family transcriptional regulator [Pseudomonadota bacterium]
MNLQAIKRRAVPLHAEVADVLRHQILSGELVTGTRLPALSKLTEQLGVARMTVVQAMNTLEEEGLIERYPGRGTFVREIKLHNRETLKMQAELSQIHSMVEQLEVSVINSSENTDLQHHEESARYRRMKRIHAKHGKPFCFVDIQLDNEIFMQAEERFKNEIVVSVLKDLGVAVESARQKVTISYADFELAQSLNISVNSAVFRVFREFFDNKEKLIYSATLLYPGDSLEFEIDFTV